MSVRGPRLTWVIVSFLLSCTAVAVVAACGSFGSDTDNATDGGPGDAAAPRDDASDSGASDASSVDAASCIGLDFQTNPKNCGACGHDCLGGACEGAVCQPFLVGTFTSDSPVFNLVADEKYVIWTTAQAPDSTGGSTYSCLKTGCADGGLNKFDSTGIGGLSSDGHVAYASYIFGASKALDRIEQGKLAPLLSNQSFVGNPALLFSRPEGIYIGSFDVDDMNDGGQDYSRGVYLYDPSVGTLVQATSTLHTGLNTTPMAVTSKQALFGSNNTSNILSAKIGSAMNTWSTFFSGASFPTDMTASDDVVVWLDLSGVYSCADNGNACTGPNPLFSNPDGKIGVPVNVTFAAGDLYVQSNQTDGGYIYKCQLPDCASPTLVVHEEQLETPISAGHTVFADATAVYYVATDPSDAGGGTMLNYRIMKLAK